MIKLQGRFELDEYWREVKETGDDRLQESGLDGWTVTLRPLSAADSTGGEPHDQELAVNIGVAAKSLDIAVDEQPALGPQSFVQTSIIDVIDQAIGATRDDILDDLRRDEGGES